MPNYKPFQQQKGITLIVTLIVLVAMTTLGLASIRSTNIERAIIKNTQFLMSARNIATAEINGQLDFINTDDSLISRIIPDSIALNTVNSIASTLGTDTDNGGLTSSTAIQTTFDQQVGITKHCRACDIPGGGFSLDLSLAALVGSINSTAQVSNSAATSTQSQGFWYLVPGDND
jgi:hypothetical protein